MVSLTNSIDIIANSVRIINGNIIEHISDIFLSKTEALTGIVGLPVSTLDTLEKIGAAIHDDPDFVNSITNDLNLKADRSTTYTKNSS